MPVHPHLRGEHLSSHFTVRAKRGSSPPAWGTYRVATQNTSNSRFIPTCVGNILVACICMRYISVHPHLRGEHISPSSPVTLSAGSSPPAWGTSRLLRSTCSRSRFIPTCVGNISRKRLLSRRSCGSSPPAWGTCIIGCQTACDLRFIPTCVGNISRTRKRASIVAVHPHLRGEHPVIS